MGFNSKRFISTRYFSSTLRIHTSLPLFSSTLFSTIPHKEVYKNRIKVGVEEKKKNTGDEKGFRS